MDTTSPNSIPNYLRPRLYYADSCGSRNLWRTPGLQRVMRGVYIKLELDRQRWEQRFTVSLGRAMAALRTTPSARCLTHTSAALVHGLSMWTQEPDVYLALPSRPQRCTVLLPTFHFPATGEPVVVQRAGVYDARVRIHRRCLEVADEEIEVVSGVAVTTILRTAFDAACDEPPANALSIADAALRRYCQPDLWHPEACQDRLAQARAYWDALLERHRGRRGLPRARAVLAVASPWAMLPGESVLRWLVLSLGLPAPSLQRLVVTRRGEYFIDLCWPEFGIALEFDGRLKYRTEDDVFAEKLRQDAIHDLGWDFLRVTWQDLQDMAALADRLLRLFPASVVAGLRPPRDLAW
ncbi:hypothetical protein ACSL103130_12990 [Actinomyces slackii]|uniref:DUF559 domain-containing protein n=1 Tax=Actinomyces slackii TaxID=52774 RepID=A0A448KBU3_9ACTO|nr:hypothetical protein [Actinomyces slackii]VEG74394.1 Uncharacterised protein [Actinomyces slackii]